MELSQCKFYYAGDLLNFVVFSDAPCLARYRDSVRLLPISPSEVYVYEINPARRASGSW